MTRKTVAFLAEKLLVKEKHHSIVIENYRRSQCLKCEYYNEKDIQCNRCKCLLDVKWKSLVNRKVTTGKLEITHCIEGRWNDADLAKFYNKNLRHDFT